MKKYLLFDLDGTLTDPKIGITTCVQYALHSFGIEEPDLDKKLWQNTESAFRIRDFLKMRSMTVFRRC